MWFIHVCNKYLLSFRYTLVILETDIGKTSLEEVSLEISCEIWVGSFQKEMRHEGHSNERIYMEILATLMSSFICKKQRLHISKSK